jgi:glycosyltransferase involved in cell wall biosynthesis
VSAQRQITADRLAAILKPAAGKPFSFTFENGLLSVVSTQPDETHEYLYANQLWRPEELGYPQSNKFRLQASPGLNIHVAFLFLDEKKQRIGHKVCPASRNESVTLPEGTAFIQLGLRLYGSGSAKIAGLLLDHLPETPPHLFGRSDYLLLTNHYPADSDLYRNAFVHRRIMDYRRQGQRVDVFRFRAGDKLSHREFEGVDVINGGAEALAALFRSNDYKAVLIHFLDETMWQVLREQAKRARVLIWLHGAEVQAWHRRSFNYTSDSERDAAKLKSVRRDSFWRSVLDGLPSGGKLIFVSRHFAQQTLSDLGLGTEHPHCTVIHNLIDGELFRYQRKSPAQRLRVLSIRPYVSRKYANDLAVAAILELSKKPYFDQLFFHLIGDGPLFEQTLAPLRGFANVQLEKGFLTQQQIAELHRDYGVFLCPTRDDTQGVSRDEAMASGLVPVTSRVSAVPEFVDDTCAMLAAPESYQELAEGIARLFEQPALFARMSEQAAERVRRQSSAAETTRRELALILGHELAPGIESSHV